MSEQNKWYDDYKNELRSLAKNVLDSDKHVRDADITNKSKDELISELQVHQVELELQNEELRTTQDEVDRARNRYFAFFDLAPVAYIITDRFGVIEKANLAACELLEIKRSINTTAVMSAFVHNGWQTAIHAHRERVFETGMKQTDVVQLHSRGGRQFTAKMVSVLYAEQDAPQRCLSAIIAIHDDSAALRETSSEAGRSAQ